MRLSTAEFENTHKFEASFAYNEGLMCIIKGSENKTVALYSKGGRCIHIQQCSAAESNIFLPEVLKFMRCYRLMEMIKHTRDQMFMRIVKRGDIS